MSNGTATATGQADAQPMGLGAMGRHSLIYGVGMLLTKAVAFLMLPIYTNFLTPADYGVLQLVQMTLEVATIFAGSRIAFGIFHYYHKAESDEQRRGVLSTALMLLALTYGAASLAAIALAPGIADLVFGEGGRFTMYIRIAAASMAFEGLIVVPTALFQLRNRSGQFVILSLVRLGLQVVLNLIFLIPLRMGVLGVLLSGLISNAIIGTGLAAHMIAQVGARFRSSAAREFLRFGLPLVAMQVATFLFTFGDRYFLNRSADEAAVGLYGLAYQFGFLVATVGFMPFQRVWDPQRFAVAKRPDRDAVYARVFVYLNLGLVSAALAISLFGGDVIRIMSDPSYHSAAAFVPLIVAAYVLHCWANFLNIGIYVTEKTEYFTAANWAAAFVALGGYLLLIPRWHAWGAAIATFASLFVRCWLAYAFSQRLWPVRYDWGPVLRIIGIASAIGIGAAVAPQIPLLLSVPVHGALLALYGFLVLRYAIDPTERAAVIRFVKSRLPRR